LVLQSFDFTYVSVLELILLFYICLPRFCNINSILLYVTEDEEGIPTLSVITTMAAVAVIALRRRPE